MAWPPALRSLARPAVRRFFLGQSVSLLGSWMQPVAVSWLAWRLARSEALLGVITFATHVPVFFLAGAAGVAADRFPRKPMVMAAMTVAMLHAAALAFFTFTGSMTPALLAGLAVVLGVAYAFEIPARQALFGDLAGADTPNVVALNSTAVTAMRVVGPAVGGLLVATVGEAWCFTVNAVSFLAVLVALAGIPVARAAAPRLDRSMLGGVRFARAYPRVGAALGLLFATALLGLPWATLMPVVAEKVLSGGPGLLGQLLACAGVGSLAGALSLLLRRGRLDARVGVGVLSMGAGLVALSLSRSAALSAAALLLVGFGQLSMSSGTLTLLQTWAPAELRGRVMGLFTALFVGVPPFGALVVGAAAHRFGAPAVLRVQGAAVMVVAVVYLGALAALRKTPLPEGAGGESVVEPEVDPEP